MTLLRALAAALLALLAAAGATSALAQASDGTVMRRTTLVVHDVERSAHFYEILGFERWYVGAKGKVGPNALPVEGVKMGDPSQLIIMRGKDPYLGMVGLLQYGAPKPRKGKWALKKGDPVLMIEIRDMAGVEARLRAAGFTIHKAPETSHIKSVSSEWDAKFMFAIDPDGHMLELTERLN
jgi:catechol 2,3-dioxygenase-like lactoylglutathione lyase family enzyme